jgi:parallel beta-helix repeat protein
MPRNRGSRVSRIGCAGMLVLGAVACSSGSDDVLNAGLLTVDPSGSADFTTIQAALDSAGAGATIEVEGGTYTENLEIEQPVTLRAVGAANIQGLPGSPTIHVRGTSDVRIEGFTIQGPTDGVQISDSARVVLTSIVASRNGDEGVDVQSSTDIEVDGMFVENAGEGIQVRGGSARVTIHSSTVTGSAEDGVRIEFSNGITVHSSTVSGNLGDGVKVESSGGCTVRDNQITSNGDDGILVGESTGAQLLRNAINSNLGNGIRLRASPDTVYTDNTFSANGGLEISID